MIIFSALRDLDLKMFSRLVKVMPYNLLAVVKLLSKNHAAVFENGTSFLNK